MLDRGRSARKISLALAIRLDFEIQSLWLPGFLKKVSTAAFPPLIVLGVLPVLLRELLFEPGEEAFRGAEDVSDSRVRGACFP